MCGEGWVRGGGWSNHLISKLARSVLVAASCSCVPPSACCTIIASSASTFGQPGHTGHTGYWGRGGNLGDGLSRANLASTRPDHRLLSADWNGHCLLLQWAEKTTNVCNIGVIHTFDGYIYLDDCHCPLVISARAATRHQAVSVCPINSRQQSRFGKNNGCVECWVLGVGGGVLVVLGCMMAMC